MTRIIDTYYSLLSPWTYLGWPRLDGIAAGAGATVNFKPVDLGAVFPVSGGLPLGKRARQRRAYRMMELRRWRDHLAMPLTLEPKYFLATDERPAALLVVAARESGAGAGPLSNAILRACWAEERNIADHDTLGAICAESGLDGEALLARAGDDDIAAAYAADTAEAIERGVFGAPTYAYNDELFWGQDRLEFLERAVTP